MVRQAAALQKGIQVQTKKQTYTLLYTKYKIDKQQGS